MKLNGKSVVVTGSGSGIGRALAMRFAQEGANVVVSDLNFEAAQTVATEIGGLAVACNVRDESEIQALVAVAENENGPVDLFYSNAGVVFGEGSHAASANDNVWQACWEIHVMSHVYAARAVLPSMIERGDGYLLQMASAAGLLSQIGDAAYSATKHAAVAFAESLAISHGDQGIKVSVICPQYVATPMLGYSIGNQPKANTGTISVDTLADCVIEGITAERFLILPHPEVQTFIEHKAADRDRWLSGMRRLRRDIIDKVGGVDLKALSRLF